MWCCNTNKLIYLIILFFPFSCKEKGYDSDIYKINLVQVSDTLNIIQVETCKNGKPILKSTWELKYPVYRFEIGDVTNDSIPEIAVGVIKSTRYDSELKKRLFLFRITEEGYVRPLWLGSQVGKPLEDFVLTKNEHPAKILTIEKEDDSKFLVASYSWHGFGLKFNEYLKREISKEEAQLICH